MFAARKRRDTRRISSYSSFASFAGGAVEAGVGYVFLGAVLVRFRFYEHDVVVVLSVSGALGRRRCRVGLAFDAGRRTGVWSDIFVATTTCIHQSSDKGRSRMAERNGYAEWKR
jgi:hypothetical protein